MAPYDAPFGGSIPACAGEPVTVDTNRIPQKVYPRVCGGNPLPVILPFDG